MIVDGIDDAEWTGEMKYAYSVVFKRFAAAWYTISSLQEKAVSFLELFNDSSVNIESLEEINFPARIGALMEEAFSYKSTIYSIFEDFEIILDSLAGNLSDAFYDYADALVDCFDFIEKSMEERVTAIQQIDEEFKILLALTDDSTDTDD